MTGTGQGAEKEPSELSNSPEDEQPGARELRSSLRAAKERHNEELQQFAYAVSHDLREPLRMVASYTQLLARRYQDKFDDEGREFTRYIVEGVERMERLLTDLLAYSHQLGALDRPLSPVDPEAALQGVLLALEPEIRESGARITYDSLPKLTFDFAQLSQLLRQLIANSIKFRSAEPPRIHVSAEETGQEWT